MTPPDQQEPPGNGRGRTSGQAGTGGATQAAAGF
jgi:hypothetical protein